MITKCISKHLILFAFGLVFLNSPAFSKEKIAFVSHGGVGNPFWTVVFNGAKKAAEDLGVQVQILFPNTDGNQAETTQKLSEALSTHPDGIAVTLATPAHCEYIKEAQKRNIPLLIYNAQARGPGPDCPYLAYIGMDETEAGRRSAKRIFDLGLFPAGKSRILVGLTEAGHAGLQARARGITEVLKSKKMQVDVVDLGNDPAGVPARLKSSFAKNKASLAGFFIPSPNGLHPLIRLREEDPTGIGALPLAGFDLTPLILQTIKAGKMDHTIDQQPYLQGYYAVAQLAWAIRGKFAPMDMNTGAALVTQATASEVVELVKKGIR